MEKNTIQRLLQKKRYDFEDLKEIMVILRSGDGCPWDRQQTHRSIRDCMIEEAYEVVEAIDNDDPVLLREELGDVLFQVVFHARLSDEAGQFDVNNVIHDICVKMITRHPHVFAGKTVGSEEDVLKLRNEIKTEEKQRKTLSERLRAIPPMLPALMRAEKVCEKSGTAKPENESVLTDRLQVLVGKLPDAQNFGQVLGEVLLTLCGLAGIHGVSAEEELKKATDYQIMESEASEISKN